MSSPQTNKASSKRAYDDDHGLLLEQTAPRLLQDSIGSLKNKAQLALNFQSSDRDLGAETTKCMDPTREQVVAAALNSRPAGRLCEPNHEPTDHENTNTSGALFSSEQIRSSLDTRTNPQEAFAVECTNRTAEAPSECNHKPPRAGMSFQLQRPNKTAIAPLIAKYKPLGHQLEANSKDDADLATTAWKELQEQMTRVPAEICQTIMDIVFEGAFGPRRVHPHKDPPIMNIFLALDRELYRKFHQQYWTKNTWIISKGPLNDTMRFMTEKSYNETTTEFSLQIPNKAALQIRSVELSFSNADAPYLSEWQQLAEQSAAAAPNITPRPFGPITTQPPTEVQIAQQNESRIRYDDAQHELIHTWQDKFDRVAMLNLWHLTLDFTEAYDAGGLYLGVSLVRRLIPFAYGMPYDFKILAPDSLIERQIREAFLVLNAV